MNHLLRDLAPISAAAWQQIEEEAGRTLKTTLAARKLVDFSGPRGWDTAAVGLGRSEPVPTPAGSEAEARVRRVLPLVELRVAFDLRRAELDAAERGAKDIDLAPAIQAARRIAIAEDRAVFHGHTAAGIRGMCETGGGAALGLGGEVTGYPKLIATAIGRLRDRGIGGPYAVALSERAYTELTEATQHGYPVLQHVRRLIGDGPLVWAPGLDGALVVSMRGGDFELTVGQDFSIGYLSHTAETVRLYLEETFTFWNITPEAAEPLLPEA
ncbi:MAG TPA: family 1 encapsulin nanocompartment shell protein [Acetobacteraceae bacterium]|nr:family 1 encapsulin nanocompartment shell protein [Acetobacteraceae bacterium]